MFAVRALLAATASACLVASASANPAPETKGRYTMTPVEGGFMRLDTETGAVSFCTRKAEVWSCEPVADKSASSDDKARLEAENKDLKDRIKALEGNSPQAQAPGGVTKLPTEKEVDEALDYVERLYKKFRDRIQKIEPPASTPPPAKPSEGGPGAL
jgi:hypothetical protein